MITYISISPYYILSNNILKHSRFIKVAWLSGIVIMINLDIYDIELKQKTFRSKEFLKCFLISGHANSKHFNYFSYLHKSM